MWRFWFLVVLLLISLACSLPFSSPTPALSTLEAPVAEESATVTPAPSAQAGPAATSARADCGEDVDCLIRAAQACQPTEGTYALQSDMMGIISQMMLHFVIQGPTADEQCAFEVSPLSVSLEYTDEVRQMLSDQGLSDDEIEAQHETMEDAARENAPSGSCIGPGADLAALLQRWENGSYALDDWDAFTCTGGTLAQSGAVIVLTAEITVDVIEETATPTPSGSATASSAAYPTPQISLLRIKPKGGVFIYYIRVDNREAYPEVWFQPAPDLPPCGQNYNAARAWVYIIDADTETQLYGYCALKSIDGMDSLWFRWPNDKPPPRIVVDIWDRQENVHYRSEPMPIPTPTPTP